MEFNDCDDIAKLDMLTFDDIVMIVEFHCRHSIVDDIIS